MQTHRDTHRHIHTVTDRCTVQSHRHVCIDTDRCRHQTGTQKHTQRHIRTDGQMQTETQTHTDSDRYRRRQKHIRTDTHTDTSTEPFQKGATVGQGLGTGRGGERTPPCGGAGFLPLHGLGGLGTPSWVASVLGGRRTPPPPGVPPAPHLPDHLSCPGTHSFITLGGLHQARRVRKFLGVRFNKT